MSLVVFTKDSNHIGGIYVGLVEAENIFFSGNSYLGCVIGVSSTQIYNNAHNYFKTNGFLTGIHPSGVTHGKQYVVCTENNFFVEQGGMHAKESILIQDTNTLMIGNRLMSGTTVYQQIFDSISQSNQGVSDKLVSAVKIHKTHGLDRGVVTQSCFALEMVVIDYNGNVVNHQIYYNKFIDPIDLLS
jgi:hypothetical protein